MQQLHPKARESFSSEAERLKGAVREMPGRKVRKEVPSFDIQASAELAKSDVIGPIKTVEHIVNGKNEETGRSWVSNGRTFGWFSEDYVAVKGLASTLCAHTDLKEKVSHSFVMDLLFEWLQHSLEGKIKVSFADHLQARLDTAVKKREIWVPLFETFSSVDFTIGEVSFRSIDRSMFDEFFSNIGKIPAEHQKMVEEKNLRTRAKFQAKLAACVSVEAEGTKALEIAQVKATEATNLLRFLSLANFTCKLQCYAVPVGFEDARTWHSFEVAEGKLVQMNSSSTQRGSPRWCIDENRQGFQGLLGLLANLASDQSTLYRQALWTSLQVYGRNNITRIISDKLLFVIASLEAFLLKEASEPIQANLSERMAFIIGKSLEQRKQIVRSVKFAYGLRSKVVHHAQTLDETEKLDEFFEFAWLTYFELLNNMLHYKDRIAYLSAIDDRKLS